MQTPRNLYRNILIIKPGAVGDLLQMTPVIRALRTYSPDSVITLMVGFGSTAALFRNDPSVCLRCSSSGDHCGAGASISS
jgi:hypothetical protein